MEWEKSDRALKKLKQMLWGFESLRSFRDMLQKAIEQVDKARARMTKLLENVSFFGLDACTAAILFWGLSELWNEGCISRLTIALFFFTPRERQFATKI